MTPDFDGRFFVSVPEVASVIGRDERTVRRAIAAGKIPSTQIGAQHMIPVTWLLEQAGLPGRADAPAAWPDLDQLADRVADRVLTRLARLFGQAPDVTAAGPAPPGSAATVTDSHPAREARHAQNTSPA